jgi:hypothetical protein
MEQKVTNLSNRTNGTEFYDHNIGETLRVHTRLAVPETRTFRVGKLNRVSQRVLWHRAHSKGERMIRDMCLRLGQMC